MHDVSAGPDRTTAHQDVLALAAACAAGDEAAWERFVRDFQPALRRAAMAIDPVGGVDLADELIADLFGMRERAGERQSLFRYFHGRSSLSTWLRAVLAQRHVDRIRATRRLVPLPDDDRPPGVAVGRPVEAEPADPDESRCRSAVRASLAAAIARLEPRDRLRLMCYYVQELKLAAIGKMFKEHEATASRHLARVRRELRASVESEMRATHGYGDAALRDCLRSVMDDAGDLDLSGMLARSGGRIVQNKEDSR